MKVSGTFVLRPSSSHLEATLRTHSPAGLAAPSSQARRPKELRIRGRTDQPGPGTSFFQEFRAGWCPAQLCLRVRRA